VKGDPDWGAQALLSTATSAGFQAAVYLDFPHKGAAKKWILVAKAPDVIAGASEPCASAWCALCWPVVTARCPLSQVPYPSWAGTVGNSAVRDRVVYQHIEAVMRLVRKGRRILATSSAGVSAKNEAAVVEGRAEHSETKCLELAQDVRDESADRPRSKGVLSQSEIRARIAQELHPLHFQLAERLALAVEGFGCSREPHDRPPASLEEDSNGAPGSKRPRRGSECPGGGSVDCEAGSGSGGEIVVNGASTQTELRWLISGHLPEVLAILHEAPDKCWLQSPLPLHIRPGLEV